MSVLMKSIVLSSSHQIMSEDVLYKTKDSLNDSVILKNKIFNTIDLDYRFIDFYDRLEYDISNEVVTYRLNKQNPIKKKNLIYEKFKQKQEQTSASIELNKYQISKTDIHIYTKTFSDLIGFFIPFVFWYDIFGNDNYNYACRVREIFTDNYIVEILYKTEKIKIDNKVYNYENGYSKVYKETTIDLNLKKKNNQHY